MKNEPQEIKITIPSRLDELHKIERISTKVGKKMHLSRDQQDNLSIAVTEAVGNAIVHGNKKNPEKTVDIHIRFKKGEIQVSVTDQGKGFNPDTLSNPLDPDNILKESGRGIFILKTLMEDVHWSFSPEGTTIHFVMKT